MTRTFFGSPPTGGLTLRQTPRCDCAGFQGGQGRAGCFGDHEPARGDGGGGGGGVGGGGGDPVEARPRTMADRTTRRFGLRWAGG